MIPCRRKSGEAEEILPPHGGRNLIHRGGNRLSTYKLDQPYKLEQLHARFSGKRKNAVWPASKGQAIRPDKVGQPKGKAEIKALKRARTKAFRQEQV